MKVCWLQSNWFSFQDWMLQDFKKSRSQLGHLLRFHGDTNKTQQLTLNMFTKDSHLGLKGLIMETPPIGRCGIRRSQRNRFWVAHATASSEGFSLKTLCCGSCGDMNCHLLRLDWCDAETTPFEKDGGCRCE